MKLWGIITATDLLLIVVISILSFVLAKYIVKFAKITISNILKSKHKKIKTELIRYTNVAIRDLLIFSLNVFFFFVLLKVSVHIVLIDISTGRLILISNIISSVIAFSLWIIVLIFVTVLFKIYKKRIKPHNKKENKTFLDFFKKTISPNKRKKMMKKTRLIVLFLINLYFLLWILKIWNFQNLLSKILLNIDSFVTIQYVKAIFIFLVFFILSKTTIYISNHYINIYLQKKEKFFNEVAAKKIEIHLAVLISLIGLVFSVNIVNRNSLIFLPLLKSTIVVMFVITINYAIDIFVKMWAKSGHHKNDLIEPSVAVFLENFFKVLSLIVSLLLFLMIWGLSAELKDVLLSLSVIGVIAGFALKDNILNVINGLSMIVDKDYNPGDIIQVTGGEVGVVRKIGLRSTKIKTFNNKLIIIPNTEMATSKITNLTNPSKDIRIDIDINVEYETDIDKFTKIVKKCIIDQEGIIKHELAELRFMKMGDYALEFKFVFFIDNYRNYFKILNIMNRKIYAELKKHKIVIPFPIQTIKINKQNKPWLKN